MAADRRTIARIRSHRRNESHWFTQWKFRFLATNKGSRHDLYSPLPSGLHLKNLVDGLRLNGDHQRRRAEHVRDWLAFSSEEPYDPTGQAGGIRERRVGRFAFAMRNRLSFATNVEVPPR
jgi:hypothetical protein